METVRKARMKYYGLLIDYVTSTSAHLSEGKKAERVSKLYSIIPHVIHVGDIDHTYLSRMVALNHGEMAGQLSRDLHFGFF
uniref:DNA-directed DNA polymerase n=1 Tax=Heterorhabditis bacteriophora TaxID=37862 RepID=A0A1I7WUA1_HETBA